MRSASKSRGRPRGRPYLGALLLFRIFNTGWNDVPKMCSMRKGCARRRPSQRKIAADSGKAHAGLMPAEKNTRNHAKLARVLVLKAWPRIVRGLIEKAASGGHQQAKLLADLFDLTSIETSQLDGMHRQQLCDVLLEELGLLPAQSARATEAMSNTHANDTGMQ